MLELQPLVWFVVGADSGIPRPAGRRRNLPVGKPEPRLNRSHPVAGTGMVQLPRLLDQGMRPIRIALRLAHPRQENARAQGDGFIASLPAKFDRFRQVARGAVQIVPLVLQPPKPGLRQRRHREVLSIPAGPQLQRTPTSSPRLLELTPEPVYDGEI